MDKWLDIPKDRTRLPIGRLCVILALTILILLLLVGRESTVLAELGCAALGMV